MFNCPFILIAYFRDGNCILLHSTNLNITYIHLRSLEIFQFLAAPLIQIIEKQTLRVIYLFLTNLAEFDCF